MPQGSNPPANLAAPILAAVIRNRFGTDPQPVSCAFAAAVSDSERLAILLPSRAEDDGADVKTFGLGSVLVWARDRSDPIVVVAPGEQAPAIARQADAFDEISVWTIEGTSIVPAAAEPLPPVPDLSVAALAATGLFEAVGAIAVDDFGRLIAEVEGLEIARADGVTGRIEVGVGSADRELHGYVHTTQAIEDSLQNAAEMVRSVRAQGPASHPLNRRARQRWLRATAHADPSMLGVEQLTMLPPLEERSLQLGPEPCAALDPGSDTLFVFSAGIDPELVPTAVDYRTRHTPVRTVLVTSAADAFGATGMIADRVGIETTTIPAPY